MGVSCCPSLPLPATQAADCSRPAHLSPLSPPHLLASAVIVCTLAAVSSMVTGVVVGVLGLAEALPHSAGAALVRLISWAFILVGVAGELGGLLCVWLAGLQPGWLAAYSPAGASHSAATELLEQAVPQGLTRWPAAGVPLQPTLAGATTMLPPGHSACRLQCWPTALAARGSWPLWCLPSCRLACGRCCPSGAGSSWAGLPRGCFTVAAGMVHTVISGARILFTGPPFFCR